MLNVSDVNNSIDIFKNALDITKETTNWNSQNSSNDNLFNKTDNIKMEIDLLNSKIYNNLGNAYRKIKDFDNSFKYYVMCINIDNLYTYYTACFNLGTMLLAKGDLLSGINYLEKALNSGNKEIIRCISSKGINFLFDHLAIKEAVVCYFKKKFNSSIIKLKSIYCSHEDNPIINFFLAYNYLALLKYEKSTCFFNKLLLLNTKNSLEKYSFLRKFISKAKLIVKKIPTMEKSVNVTYLKEILSFIDFPYISEIEDYEDLVDESIDNKINTELNIIFKNTERTKRLPDGVITSYNELKKKKNSIHIK